MTLPPKRGFRDDPDRRSGGLGGPPAPAGAVPKPLTTQVSRTTHNAQNEMIEDHYAEKSYRDQRGSWAMMASRSVIIRSIKASAARLIGRLSGRNNATLKGIVGANGNRTTRSSCCWIAV